MKKETMTRRERVLAAIEHREADRVPIDFGVHFSTGISAFAYKRLREHLGYEADIVEAPDYSQMLARVERDVLERFHSDTILLNPPAKKTHLWNARDDYKFLLPESIKPELKNNGDWIISRNEQSTRMPVGGYFFDGDWIRADEYADEDEQIKSYTASAEKIFKETDYFTMQMGFSGYFHGIDFACQILTDPDEAIELQEQVFKDNMERAKKMLDTYGKYIQSIEVNSDLGAQHAPFIRPELYEEFCMPYLKRFNEFIHNNSDIKIFMHCCGSVEPLIPYIIEAGVDALNPIQISASNMDPAALKEKYGKQICFWGGGCDTQYMLPKATPDEIRTHVRDLVRIFKPGGGFVFTQVHNIMGNVPPENIVAMFDTAYEESWY